MEVMCCILTASLVTYIVFDQCDVLQPSSLPLSPSLSLSLSLSLCVSLCIKICFNRAVQCEKDTSLRVVRSKKASVLMLTWLRLVQRWLWDWCSSTPTIGNSFTFAMNTPALTIQLHSILASFSFALNIRTGTCRYYHTGWRSHLTSSCF